MKYLRQAERLKNSFAMCNLGHMYCNELENKDLTKGLQYFEKSANLGNPSALSYLGRLYEKGIFVEKNVEKAIKFYESAIHLDCIDAMIFLGKIYKRGIGVDKDYKKAMALYQQAASLKNQYAFYLIGKMYENGQGVPKDILEALKFYRKALNTGEIEIILKANPGVLGIKYHHAMAINTSLEELMIESPELIAEYVLYDELLTVHEKIRVFSETQIILLLEAQKSYILLLKITLFCLLHNDNLRDKYNKKITMYSQFEQSDELWSLFCYIQAKYSMENYEEAILWCLKDKLGMYTSNLFVHLLLINPLGLLEQERHLLIYSLLERDHKNLILDFIDTKTMAEILFNFIDTHRIKMISNKIIQGYKWDSFLELKPSIISLEQEATLSRIKKQIHIFCYFTSTQYVENFINGCYASQVEWLLQNRDLSSTFLLSLIEVWRTYCVMLETNRSMALLDSSTVSLITFYESMIKRFLKPLDELQNPTKKRSAESSIDKLNRKKRRLNTNEPTSDDMDLEVYTKANCPQVFFNQPCEHSENTKTIEMKETIGIPNKM